MSGPTRLRPMHEQLKGYLAAEGGLPTEVAAPDASPRHPMAPPNKRVPKGRRPIPASSEGPKKTNAQIPYARLLIKTVPEGDPLNRVRPGEGDVVFVERNLHYTHATSAAASRLGSQTGSLCRVRTLQDLNRELSRRRRRTSTSRRARWRRARRTTLCRSGSTTDRCRWRRRRRWPPFRSSGCTPSRGRSTA